LRDKVAERLLANVLSWKTEDVTRERPILQALASLKYDQYQQFSTGMRFVESLAFWLHQFDESERITAYNFIRERLIFISEREMRQLITITYPDFIRPILLDSFLKLKDQVKGSLKEIVDEPAYKSILRRSLFWGLSDGAKLDIFRRSNPEVNHEQVWQTYDVSEPKADDFIKSLDDDLLKLDNKLVKGNKFNKLFLVDDFSGSGISYIRPVKASPEHYTGKIPKIVDQLLNRDLKTIFDIKELEIYIILYVATEQAIEYIEKSLQIYRNSIQEFKSINIVAIQIIPRSVSVDEKTESDLVKLSETYFDKEVITTSYSQGRINKPYLGFDECGLPLVLYHNSPNNSLTLLWQEENRIVVGLFPRVSRHRI
jgi:hypothetical protein